MADLLEQLESSRRLLMDAIAGLDEEGFRARPEPGAWTAAEVLTHVLAHEERFSWLIEQALTQDDPAIQSRGGNQQLQEAALAKKMAVPQIVHGLLARHRDLLRALDALSAEQLQRTVRHSRFGEISAAWMFQRVADHEREHAAQIRERRHAAAGA